MRRHFRLFKELLRVNLVRDMEFRGNFILQFILEWFWVAIQLFTIGIYFSFTDSILGWSKLEVLLLFGLFRLIKGVFDFAFYENLFNLSDTINKGEMDFLLTKPVNSLFITSLQTMAFPELGEFLIGVLICVYALVNLHFQASLLTWVIFIFAVFMGIAVYYCFVLIFSTLAFFTNRLTALSAYQDIVKQVLRYPTDILRTRNSFLVFIVFALALVATYPAQILLAKIPLYSVIFQFIGLALFLFLCIRFWNHALRRYSSASS